MCLYPRIMLNPKYKANKKNGGIIPAVNDTRALYVPVGCQRCIECRKQKTREWQTRLTEDIKTNKNGYFVTLTFNTKSLIELANTEEVKGLEGYALDNAIATTGTRRFLERWRKHHKKSVRHWLITELGTGEWEHIHIHGIIWTDKEKAEINKIWGYGYTVIRNYVSNKTINYIVKYIKKTDIKHKTYIPKMLTSAGIGEGYTQTHNAKTNTYKPNGETKETYTNKQGYQMNMPAYWKNKIYTEEEKEKLWMEKLDKKERYILGKKIDVSKDENEYYRALAEARAKNLKLGYGNDEKNWSLAEYEKQRRNIIHKKRLEIEIPEKQNTTLDLYSIGQKLNG